MRVGARIIYECRGSEQLRILANGKTLLLIIKSVTVISDPSPDWSAIPILTLICSTVVRDMEHVDQRPQLGLGLELGLGLVPLSGTWSMFIHVHSLNFWDVIFSAKPKHTSCCGRNIYLRPNTGAARRKGKGRRGHEIGKGQG